MRNSGNLNLHVIGKSEEQILNSLVDEIDENEMNSTDNDDKLFDDMIIIKYGKGYLLHSYEDHPDFGTKYYHNAWWMPKQTGMVLQERIQGLLH